VQLNLGVSGECRFEEKLKEDRVLQEIEEN
jgi:hypothetical protein